jgi:MbtH protein
VANPFEDDAGEYLVLVNKESQYSLWPSFRKIPDGWVSIGPRGQRKDCIDWINHRWTDMRPRSLAEEMAKDRNHT